MNSFKRGLRRSTNEDNIMMASRQARLASQNDTYRSNNPPPRALRPAPTLVRAADPLAGYDAAIAAAGRRHGVHDETVSRRALRRQGVR